MYQSTTIIGNVGNDPEMRYTQNGKAVTSFTVAVNKTWTGADGQKQEKATWFKIACWEKLAEITAQYVHKGDKILVVGEVSTQAFTDKSGEHRASLEIRADTVKFLGSKADNATSPASAPTQEVTPEEIPF